MRSLNQRTSQWEDVMLHYQFATFHPKNIRNIFNQDLKAVPYADSAYQNHSQRCKSPLGRSTNNAISSNFRDSVIDSVSKRRNKSFITNMNFESYKDNLRKKLSSTCLEKLFGFKWVRSFIFLSFYFI